MTTPWQITPIWAGETVAILGAGPDMTAELAATAKGYKTIAVNRAVKFAPWADMFVALDPLHPFWEGRESFEGIKICGVECDYDARYVGMLYETVQIAEGHTIEIRNNALAAIRLAERCGAKKILLLGFDAERYQEVHGHTGFYGLAEGLVQIIAELKAKGIEVEQVDSAQQFPGKSAERRNKDAHKDTTNAAAKK